MNFFNNYINNKEDGTTGKNILTAYTIVLAHIFLLFCVGLAILFFKGFYIYIGWILAGIGLFAIGVCFFVYHRLSRSSSDIRNILAMPEFKNRSLEIKLFGGLAAFKIDPEQDIPPAPTQTLAAPSKLLLTDTTGTDADTAEHKILKLISLFEKELITEDEFKKAKQKILEENI
ncbi:MAG: SHOCT domain-containing protein [Desulfobacula sp.]|nr:SHOCT domain-containing protein [Desulfobacula sp.]